MDAVLTIQLYREGLAPLTLDLAPMHRAERRISEIGYASKTQAQELFTAFLHGYVNATKALAQVKLHQQKATTAARRRRSVLLIDHIPTMAKEKGLASARNATGSEDVREAFYYADPEYVQIENCRDHLEATYALIFGKMIAMKAAYEACKAMLSPNDRPYQSNMTSIPGSAGVDERPKMVEEEHEDFGEPSHKR